MTLPLKKNLMDQLPALSKLQLEVLSKIYPDRSPDVGTPMDQVWFKAGEASVVRTLIQHAKKNTNLETNQNVFQFPQAKAPEGPH